MFPQLHGLVLSAKLEKSDLHCAINKRLIMFILYISGPDIKPWGAPHVMSRISLKKDPIFFWDINSWLSEIWN